MILDGTASTFEGNSTEAFQTLLFGVSGLDFGTHTVELVNSGGELLDVDFVSVTIWYHLEYHAHSRRRLRANTLGTTMKTYSS